MIRWYHIKFILYINSFLNNSEELKHFKGNIKYIFCKAKSIDVNTDSNTVEKKDALDENKCKIEKHTNRNKCTCPPIH